MGTQEAVIAQAEPEAPEPNPLPPPGFYRGIDYDTYASWPAANSHRLQGFAKTPAHVRHEMLKGGKSTRAMDLGWLTHLAALEPERFAAEVVVPPKLDKRTKDGKAQWAQFTAGNAEKYIVDEDDFRGAQTMAAALLAHPTAGEFLRSQGVNELSIIWPDKDSGLDCKARIDRIGTVGEWPIVGDIKTAADASKRSFERALHMYGYHVQGAHYLTGLETLVPIPAGNPHRRYVFFVVESEPPHCVVCYELDDMALQQGEEARRRYLRTYRECLETGRWPGYPDGVDLVTLPAWAFKQFEG